MYSEVKNALHSQMEEAPDRFKNAASRVHKEAVALGSAVAATAMGGRSVLDAEIANHYVSKLKFGVAGSTGTLLSNYYRHTMNNHELLSLFFADKRNPYNKVRRFFVIFSKLSLSLLLAAAFSTMHKDRYNQPGVSTPLNIQFGDSFFISLILCPYGYILDSIANCTICTRANCCIKLVTPLSYCTLLIIALVSGLFLMGGILIAVLELHANTFVRVFFFSVLLDYASYFYYGIWNWYFLSWEGFLFVPIFPLCGNSGCPCRFLPLFSLWPIKTFLRLYGLCQSTYTEDKAIFLAKYPGRVAVDVVGAGEDSGEDPGDAGSSGTAYDDDRRAAERC